MDSDNYLMANHYYLYLVIVMHAYPEGTASTQVLRYQRDKLKRKVKDRKKTKEKIHKTQHRKLKIKHIH
jgi:hypothetical protein